jgi:hypothetical protein
MGNQQNDPPCALVQFAVCRLYLRRVNHWCILGVPGSETPETHGRLRPGKRSTQRNSGPRGRWRGNARATQPHHTLSLSTYTARAGTSDSGQGKPSTGLSADTSIPQRRTTQDVRQQTTRHRSNRTEIGRGSPIGNPGAPLRSIRSTHGPGRQYSIFVLSVRSLRSEFVGGPCP